MRRSLFCFITFDCDVTCPQYYVLREVLHQTITLHTHIMVLWRPENFLRHLEVEKVRQNNIFSLKCAEIPLQLERKNGTFGSQTSELTTFWWPLCTHIIILQPKQTPGVGSFRSREDVGSIFGSIAYDLKIPPKKTLQPLLSQEDSKKCNTLFYLSQ